jgi:hypothetical protein
VATYTFSSAVTDDTREIAHTTEYRDDDGNILIINEFEGEDIVEVSPEVIDFLDDCGYDGPGDWGIA